MIQKGFTSSLILIIFLIFSATTAGIVYYTKNNPVIPPIKSVPSNFKTTTITSQPSASVNPVPKKIVVEELTQEMDSQLTHASRPSDYKEISQNQAKACALKYISDNQFKYKKLQYIDLSSFYISSETINCLSKQGRFCWYSKVGTKPIPINNSKNEGYIVSTEVNAETCEVYTDPTINNF